MSILAYLGIFAILYFFATLAFGIIGLIAFPLFVILIGLIAFVRS